jgi:hypothetical protein
VAGALRKAARVSLRIVTIFLAVLMFIESSLIRERNAGLARATPVLPLLMLR